jgi:hypothetical protein
MTLGTFLQAIISIVFIYLILALLTSELQEYLATISEARAKRLKQSIRQMLGEDGLKYNDLEGFQVFSPQYENEGKICLASWENKYSLHEELILKHKIVEEHKGQDISQACKSWIESLLISQVKDNQNIIPDGDKEVIWTSGDQEFSATEIIEDIDNPQQGFVKNLTRFPVSVDATGNKFWTQGQNQNLINPTDNTKIFTENAAEFIWVDTSQQKTVDFSTVKTNPNDPERGSDKSKSIIAKKSTVYQLAMPLKKGDRFYIDEHNREIKFPLAVNSLTEKLYQHPQIVALNQTAFRWLSFLGISFMYPSNLQKWEREDWLNLASMVILIVFVISLWLGISFPSLKIALAISFIFFISFIIVRVINFRHSQKIRRKSRNIRKSQGPSYIDDADLFVDTLIDILKKESDARFLSNDKDGVKKTLETLTFYTPAQSLLIDRVNLSSNINDVDTFKQDLKKLYEEVQKRSTGVYKRNAKGLSFLVGLLIAVVANADTFNMMTHLTKANNEFSQNLVANLAKNSDSLQCPKEKPECLNEASRQTQLKQLINNSGTLPLGWSFNELLALEHKKAALEQNQAALEQNNPTLKQQIDKIDEERASKKLAITNNQKLVAFLDSNKNPCQEQKEECLNQVVTALSQDPTPSELLPLIDQDFKNTLRQSLDNPADFSKKYQDFLTKKREQIKELKQALLRFDLDQEDIRINLQKKLGKENTEIENIKQEIEKVTKEIDKLKQSQTGKPPIPQDSQDVVTRLTQFGASPWDNIDRNVQIQGGWPRVLFGWLITAIALSMGAPFWFDLLGKIMNVRNAAKSPDSTTSSQGGSNANQGGSNANQGKQ